MNIPLELLKLKNLNPLQKLILGLILDTSPVVLQFAGGYDDTCGEIGKKLGVSRARVLKEIEALNALDFITCKVGDWRRVTNVTDKLKKLLKEDNLGSNKI